MSTPSNFHELPDPDNASAGRNTNDRGSQKPSIQAKKYRPVDAPVTEPPVATVARFANRLINRETGATLSAEQIIASSAGTPTAASVAAAIATDPAAIRTAVELGTAATSDLSGIVVPGPYADNLAAIIGGDVAKDSLYRQPLGAMGWLNLTAAAVAYQDANSTTDAAALKISGLFEGLVDIGIDGNLVDGGIFRADTQPASGDQLVSLLGLSNLTMVNAPTRERNAVYFQKTLSQYALGGIAESIGARTFIGLHSGLLENDETLATPIFKLWKDTGLTPYLAMQNNGTTFGQAVSYVSSVRTTGGNPGWSAVSTTLANVAIHDDAAAGASSLSMRRAPSPAGTTYARTSTQGEASHTLNKLLLAIHSQSAGPGSIYRYINRRIPGWLLFDVVLTDQQEEDLNTLLGNTVLPKWSMIWEGDSITVGQADRSTDKGCWAAANLAFYKVATGGETAQDCVDQLGLSTGFNTTNLAVQKAVICDVSPGHNDLANYSAGIRSVASIHANLRTIWAYIRSTNPTAAIHVGNVTRSSAIDANSRESDRQALNALIAADVGVYFDVLTDRDAYFESATVTTPYYNDAALFADGVHPTATLGGGYDQIVGVISDNLLAAGVIP